VTHDLTRTILTTVEYGAPIVGGVIGMVGAFVPGIGGQVLASSVGLLTLIAGGARTGLALIGNREAAANSIERGPPELEEISAAEEAAAVERGPSMDIGPPEAETSGPPAEIGGPPAEATGPPAEPTLPGAEQGGPELGAEQGGPELGL
jgi:hypothetical protein